MTVARRLLVLTLVAACSDEPPQSGGTTGGSGSTSDAPPGTSAAMDESTSHGDGLDSTGPSGPLVPDPGDSFYAFVNETVVLDGSGSTGATAFSWDAGDGTGASPTSNDPTWSVAYATPGRYQAVLTVTGDSGEELSASIVVTVTEVPTHAPIQSGSIVALPGQTSTAVVSPDSDEIAIVGRRDKLGVFGVLSRFDTCDGPRTLAPTGTRFAVTCPDEDLVQLVSPGGATNIAMPRGSRPFGVIAVGEELWVSLQGLGRVARIDVSDDPPVVVAQHVAVTDARGVATMPDGRIAVSRWRSPDDVAQIALVDPDSDPEAAPQIVTLQFDPKEASDTESGGIPSYLDQILVSPIANEIAIPSLQANIGQGEYLDGNPLTFETTLRGVVSYFDLTRGDPVEVFERRKHIDNHGFLSAGVFSSRGDWLFVASRGSRGVVRLDMFTGGEAGSLVDVGYAPGGLALTEEDRVLHVDAYLSREVVVYHVEDFADLPEELARVTIPSAEPLSPQVLQGKRFFNDSFDPRLAKDSYIACAHCHLDGESDLRTWDFTDRGEGIRNTISLRGRGGMWHGPLHWSSNFDEVQDFEHDIRGPFGGSGLMTDRDFESGTHDETLGDMKAGLSEDLDALAAYVETIPTYPKSPYLTPEGDLTPEAEAGRLLFESIATGCTSCHVGAPLTDSAFLSPAEPLLHDVGTITEASGQRLGGPLLGIDTPTLHELFNSAPYLHDGSAATLHEVLTTKNPDDLHGVTSPLDAAEIDALVAYLLSLEG